MEPNPNVPDPVVIGQDDQSEVHVQAVVQGGRRLLDIRIWRHGSGGLAPSRDGLTVDMGDLALLRDGIGELMQVSERGTRVARVVWDGEDGRRLRAETEPFGTRFVVRLGFWQRVRDSWKPADDGLVVAAEGLPSLQAALDRFTSWLRRAAGEEPRQMPASPSSDILNRWPPPGADWLTSEPDRIAFHPRGVRLTCTVTEQDGRHWLEIRQWRRDDTLWLPEPVSIALSIVDLDGLLSRLLRLAGAQEGGPGGAQEELRCTDGSAIRVSVVRDGTGTILAVDQRPAIRAAVQSGFEPRIRLPAEYLPRLGRALAQGWFLLAGWLSEAERASLQPSPERSERAVPWDATPTPPVRDLSSAAPAADEPLPQPRQAGPPSSISRSRLDAASGVGQVFSFGVESETPGTVILGRSEVRVVVEGILLPRSISLPLDVTARILPGLDSMMDAWQRQSRVDPVLLSDRPDCAVYGRVGGAGQTRTAELRVWTGPTTSESLSFEATYLPELIEGLREALRLAGLPVPDAPAAVEIPATPPALVLQPSSPARVRPVAPTAPLETPGPVPPTDGAPGPAAPVSIPLGAVTLGQTPISLTIQGPLEKAKLHLRWGGNILELPVNDLDDILSDIRSLYYDVLRGRRGRTLTVGDYPLVTVSVQNRGTDLYCVLQQDVDAEVTTLAFPAREVPTFLNAARAALART
ncbi:MAG: hypothetical protein JOZ41_14215 [Chloroflexi bacterium]|nr:hypothetical protein [Chloroflexota bacterium]